ncbi:MAG: RNA pseudouridine synthase [Bacteroidetes bacterium]|nr:RNA pseudouridine synthase [Bacteroidota bacterium]MBU1719823.1 RNA pseudouridine synthase [Bacteroidota bacterium]
MYEPVVIYQDNHLIAIKKRPSDIVQSDKTGDVPLSDYVKEYIRKKYNKPGAVFLGVIHRLDRPASGIVIFARTTKALSRMNALFRNKETEKIYWAVSRAAPDNPAGELKHYLFRNTEKNKTFVFDEPDKKGTQEAVLKYEVVAEIGGYFLFRIHLITGRHHQIRAQLSHIGCPIVGDNKYGYPRGNRDQSIHLHATELSFVHPVRLEPIHLIAQPFDDVIWDKFKDVFSHFSLTESE